MTYPIIIPLHHGGGKLKDDTELRFALRSLDQHFKDPFKIVIVGKVLPAWLSGAEHVYSGQGLKTALLDAAKAYPDGFFWWYDDLTLLHDITGEEMKVTPAINRWMTAQTGWANSLEKIRKRLVEEGRPAFDYSRPHGPYWFTKAMVDEGFEDWPKMKSKFPWESWILSKHDWPRRFGVVKQYYGPFNGAPGAHSVFLNYADNGNTPELRAWLEQRFPEASRFEKGPETAAIPSAEAGAKIEVHTIRFGNAWWVNFCGVTLDKWCAKHSHSLRVWAESDINPEYPAAKFCEVDMLKEFLSGNSEWMLYVDADVYVSDDAPRLFDLPDGGGFLIHDDNIVKLNRNWGTWCRNRWGAEADVCHGWRYKNAGIWACDRKSAEQMIAVIEKPYHEKVQEQHHWNWWICLAHSKGMLVHDLPVEWNSFTWRKEKAAFHHIAGKNKYRKVQDLRQAGLIPMKQKEKYQYTKTFNFEPYRFTMEGPNYMPMDEYHIHLLHLACNLDAGRPSGAKVAVEIGSFNGASTSALIEAVNKGWLAHLHVVEVKPNATLRRVMAMCKHPERITLHAKPYWETGIGYADLVFIDGDHKWPAVGDTLRALTWESAVICMHDTTPFPAYNCWGSVMAGQMLKDMKSRIYFEESAKRGGLMTDRGFLVSAPQSTDLSPIIRNTCESPDYLAAK